MEAMPPTKRRRTDRDSSASSRADDERPGSDSPRPHKSARKQTYEDKENDDPKTTAEPPVNYVGVMPHTGCSGELAVSVRCSLYFIERETNNRSLGLYRERSPSITSVFIVRSSM
jgi:hypothetical protein